jgi:hypothetical protein
MDNSPQSGLQKAEKALNSKNQSAPIDRTRFLTGKDYGIKEDWNENKEIPRQMSNKKSFWHKFLVFSIIFFIFAAALSAFIFWRGSNLVSSQNVEIIINGPVSIAAGDEMSFQVSILNRNNVALQNADLTIEYPTGTVSAENPEESKPRETLSLGKISSGDRVQKVFKAILFGEENEKRSINVVVEYRVEGSNAIFYKEKKYEFVISSAPMSLLVSGADTVNAGGGVELSVILASNSEKPITDSVLSIEYPFGFVYKDANPKPTNGNAFWNLGTLAPSEQIKITVRGFFDAEAEETRIFRVEAGSGGRTEVATVFTTYLHSVAIKKPALNLETAISGNKAREVSVLPGEQVRVDLAWENNLPNQIADVSASSKITASGFAVSGISVSSGFFRSSDNTVIWTRDRNKELGLINPGESGVLSYTFKIPTVSELAATGSVTNPTINLNNAIEGRDLAGISAGENPQTRDERLIKISSPVSVVTSVSKKSGNTYTVTLTAKNPFNNLSGVKLSASLPTYVKWQNTFNPSEESLIYNSVGGQMLWNVGKLSSGVGYSKPARQISFDIELDTSLDGLPTNSSILRDVKIYGQDDFTGQKVEFVIPSVNLQ